MSATSANLGELDSFDVKRLMALNGPAVKLQQIAGAFHRYHASNRTFTRPRLQDQQNVAEDKKSAYTELSWRVHLLPYVDQLPLYESFHLDEPWDSPHNMTLLDKMPDIYRVDLAEDTKTRFQVVTGPQCLFGNAQAPQFRDITDGQGNTILALVVGVDRAVPWTQPDSFHLDPVDPVASLGKLPEGCVLCVTADAEALPLSTSIPAEDLVALATPSGNEVVDGQKLRRAFQENYRALLTKRMQDEGKPMERDITKVTPQTAAAGRSNRLKRIAEALLEYHQIYKQFPIAKGQSESLDAQGNPLLSWRVHLLPMLGHRPLYESFKLNEPWDSPHNRSLIEKMPDVFCDPYDQLDETKTRYVRLTGPETAFPEPTGSTMRSFRDGIADTLVTVSAGADKAVIWTKPDDIPYDAESPVGCLGDLSDTDSISYVRADGGVSVLSSSVPSDMFHAIVTPSGGERLPKEFAEYQLR
ncbi:MAG: DUF1559 domain-containing protein [Planctomycetales bacterium]|nr:DUF1559 domain-containing protein [Planctomycetales bacterium]